METIHQPEHRRQVLRPGRRQAIETDDGLFFAAQRIGVGHLRRHRRQSSANACWRGQA